MAQAKKTVAETAARRAGRKRSTLATGPRGLLTEPEVKKASLLGE